MISYDVVSLFTNVPLSETIDIAVNLIFENKPELKINRRELKKLFEFATSKTHFLFNGLLKRIFCIIVMFMIKLMGLPWDLLLGLL